MTELIDPEFPALFMHSTRKDWGVGVLAGVRDGKRTYLFEGGEERIMAGGALDMMRKVESLDQDQQSTLTRLTALVARRRQGQPDASKAVGVALLEQVTRFRGAFPLGFGDPAWDGERRAARARAELTGRMKQQLGVQALDAQLKAQQFEAIWASLVEVVSATGWVSAEQIKPTPDSGLQALCGGVRELLYGTGALEQRFDRFNVAHETAFRKPARWELVTALLALAFPVEYVLVDLASFRKQLKTLGSTGTLPPRPTGAGYARCINAARIVASKLSEHGVVPRDLLDVHDFIRFTLKPSPPLRRAQAAKGAKAPKAAKGAKAAAPVEEAEEPAIDEDDN